MLKLHYDDLAVSSLKMVLRQVGQVCQELHIDFFIVGAVARNIWLASHGENPSGTKDIDLGVYIPHIDQYNLLRKKLIEKYQYIVSLENAFCLINPQGKQIDLLPFGEVEKDGQVMIDGKGLNNINLDGFKNAYNLGSVKTEIGDEIYKVCSIPAIVVLKMIAFDDRPERRVKDIKDINLICTHYPFIETNLIWEEHNDLYDGTREQDEVAMIVLGREIGKVILDNELLQKRLLHILDQALHLKSDFLIHMIEDAEVETITSKSQILKLIRTGMLQPPI